LNFSLSSFERASCSRIILWSDAIALILYQQSRQ
jgi:hypothetical protein